MVLEQFRIACLLTSLQDEHTARDSYSGHVQFPEGQLKLGARGTEIPLNTEAESPRVPDGALHGKRVFMKNRTCTSRLSTHPSNLARWCLDTWSRQAKRRPRNVVWRRNM
jgi:hypothetical protein